MVKSHKQLKIGLYKEKHWETLKSASPSPVNNTFLTGLIFLDPPIKIAKDKEDFTDRLNKCQFMALTVYLHTSHLLSFKLEGNKGIVGSGATNLHFLNSCWIPPRFTHLGVNSKFKYQGHCYIHGCLFTQEPTEHTLMVCVRIY